MRNLDVNLVHRVYLEAGTGLPPFEGIEYKNIRDWWPAGEIVSGTCCQACIRYIKLTEDKIMPMDFEGMEALRRAGEMWKFREPREGELEADYRVALADYVQPRDLIESMEIRTGKGWNKWTVKENEEMLRRSGVKIDNAIPTAQPKSVG